MKISFIASAGGLRFFGACFNIFLLFIFHSTNTNVRFCTFSSRSLPMFCLWNSLLTSIRSLSVLRLEYQLRIFIFPGTNVVDVYARLQKSLPSLFFTPTQSKSQYYFTAHLASWCSIFISHCLHH